MEKFENIFSIARECIDKAELKDALEVRNDLITYDGFEPSNKLHIAQGILKVLNFNKMIAAGITCKILIADIFAQLNGKMDGDLDKIQEAGKAMIEHWKALGMSPDVEYIFASDMMKESGIDYWTLVMDIARHNNLKRVIRCSQIMGRSESDDLTSAQILYPLMQCADIFALKADIVQQGMDQRKVNMLSREYADAKGWKKPIILSHEMLPGLLKDSGKMSKSVADNAIFLDDSDDAIRNKIRKAYCPPGEASENPCMTYMRCIIFPWFHRCHIKRENKYGGDIVYDRYEDLEMDYQAGRLSPCDLKCNLSDKLIEILKPIK